MDGFAYAERTNELDPYLAELDYEEEDALVDDVDELEAEVVESPSKSGGYLTRSRRTAFLTWEEEKALVALAQTGDEAARQQLIESHLPLVMGIANGYSYKGLPLADLIQEGNIGLIRGVDRFCPDMGTRLSSYATFWIREGMQRALIRARLIRLPDYLAKSLHARKQRQEHAEMLGHNSDEATEPSAAKAETIEASNQIVNAQVLSLDTPQNENSDRTLMDELVASMDEPETGLDMTRVRAAITECLRNLSGKQREVVILRFGLGDNEPFTLKEVASKLGISREAARQLQVRALGYLRKSLESQGWVDAEG